MFMKKKFILGVLYFSAATAQGQPGIDGTASRDEAQLKMDAGQIMSAGEEGGTLVDEGVGLADVVVSGFEFDQPTGDRRFNTDASQARRNQMSMSVANRILQRKEEEG